MVVSLFDAYRLKTCFPRSVYESKAFTNFTVHFLIALDQPIKTIADYAAKHRDQLFNHTEKDRLTPLHLAVMKGKLDVVVALLDLKAPIDAEDAYGWTPFHHSALLANRMAMQALLKERGANSDKKTTMGKTAENILGFFESSPRKCWSLPHLFYYTPIGDLKKVSNVQKELGLKSYTDQLVFSEETLTALWKAKRILDDHIGVGQLVAQVKKDLEKHPPELIVTEELERLDGGASRGLCAKGTIEPGECIGIFAGRIKADVGPKEFHQIVLAGTSHPQPLFECEDSCALVDDEESNALHFINDGNPNCAIDFSTTAERLLIAAEEIKPGDLIYMDYGLRRVDLKWGHYRILDAKGLEHCFRQHSPETMWKNICANGHGLSGRDASQQKLFKVKYVNNLYFGAKLRYAFQTPAALIYLWAKDVVKPSSWIQLLGDNDLREQLIMFETHQHHYTWVIKLLEFLEGLDKRLPKSVPMRQEVVTFVLEQMEYLTVTQVMKLFASIVEYIDSGSELEKAFAELEKQSSGVLKKARVIGQDMQVHLQVEEGIKEQIPQKVSGRFLDSQEEVWEKELVASAKTFKEQSQFENSWPTLREHLKETLPTYRWNEEKKPIFKGIVVVPDGNEKARDIARKIGLIV